MAELKKIYSNYNGQTPSTGKEVEDAFNENFETLNENLVQLAGEVSANEDLITQSYAPNINFIRYFPIMGSNLIKTNEGLLLNPGSGGPTWSATIPKFAGKVAIVFDGTVSGIETPTDKIRFLIQYTGYSAYIEITQNMDGIRVLREVDFDENIANITVISIKSQGNAQALVRNMYVGNKDRYNEPTLLQYEIDNPTLTVDNLMYLGENKSMLLPNPHDVAVPIQEVLDVSKYTTIYFRADISSVGAGVNVTNFAFLDADTNLNAINPQPLFRHQGTRGYGYIEVNVSSINRLRITVSGQGLLHELVASESIMTNKTKAVKSFGADMLFNNQVNLTNLVKNTPINELLDEGLLKYQTTRNEVTFQDEYVGFNVNKTTSIWTVPPTSYDRYFSVADFRNITGTPRIGYLNSDASITYFNIKKDESFRLPAGLTNIFLHPSGGSIEVKQLYLGRHPYNREWVENLPPREMDNYFENPELKGFQNVITNEEGERAIRIYGDGTEKFIEVEYDKVFDNGVFAFQYKTSVDVIKTRTGHINSAGVITNTLIQEGIYVYPNVNHIVQREFSEDNPGGSLRVYFTGSPSDYLEVSLPSITKDSRGVQDVLINKHTSGNQNGGGVAEYDTVKEAILDNPEGLIKVGEYLLSKNTSNPVNKSDFENIVGHKPSKSKLLGKRFVDLGDWTLKLITTDKMFIFLNYLTVKYTYDLESCLVKTEFEGEDRYTLDDSKLETLTTAVGVTVAIRELGSGELVFITSGVKHYYTSNNRTIINESNTHTPTVGSHIDTWAFDAYDDTVVFSTYSAAGATGYGKGSVILSIDSGKTYNEILNIDSDYARGLFGTTAINLAHIHGVFIDQYRDAIIVLMGDYNIDSVASGKILVLENYREDTEWRIIDLDFENGKPREQYVSGIAMQKCNLFGTDMNETCVSRQAIGIEGLNSPREAVGDIHIGLDYVPSFTRPMEEGSPIGIHFCHTGGAGGGDYAYMQLTMDGFYFPTVYKDNIENKGFGNSNGRIWCSKSGEVYITNFGGRFTRELILGKYNGFNMV
ncbi:hypothetical protein [Proteiniphilum sp.]|uniref:hypothetical protein n=1 Tax=Proteiniphilum sp. TaxID=1926877 RepID=UPI00332F16C5